MPGPGAYGNKKQRRKAIMVKVAKLYPKRPLPKIKHKKIRMGG